MNLDRDLDRRWMVVIRKVRNHSHERGIISHRGMTKTFAEKTRDELRQAHIMRDFNVWAMHEDDY